VLKSERYASKKAGTRNCKSVPTVYSGNGTENCVPFPLYTVGTLLPFLVPAKKDVTEPSWVSKLEIINVP
jgi:hypothetical protein